MRKLFVVCLMLLLGFTAVAQERQEKKEERPPDVMAQWDWAKAPYRLNFVIKELDDSKLINTRTYSMVLDSSAQGGPQTTGEIKAGSRVPLIGEKGITYMDVGVNLWARLTVKQSGSLILAYNTEVSSLAAPDMARNDGPGPLVRSMRSTTTCEVPIGKPVVLNELDDPISKHRFQLEVTVNKVK
ncbi:MAG: hypothetical protein LAO06_13615 [Acidobacteriia bacterium]|nr:hypothetical protein [Terriglobia bacterium]